MIHLKSLLLLLFLLVFASVFFAQESCTMINTPQSQMNNETTSNQQSIDSMMTSEEYSKKWDSVFSTLDNLENNSLNLEESVNTLTLNLNLLENQWWLLSERMEENDYYILQLEEENVSLTKKNNNLFWALLGSMAVCLTTGLVVGLFL